MITLKQVLLLNALSSGLTGLLLLIMPKPIAEIFEVSASEPFMVTGAFLVLFALLVGYAATRPLPAASLVKAIIFLDCLWVLASVLLLLSGMFHMSQWGYLLIAGVAAWVGLMAYLQYAGLRKRLVEERA